MTNFNSHAHVERDDYMNSNKYTRGNFNSHAHVERDLIQFPNFWDIKISTHTLTWSVT